MMLCILILASLWLQNFSVYMQACITPVPISCTFSNSSTILVTVAGVTPQGTCNSVLFGSQIYIYDPIAINSVLITLSVPNTVCPASIPAVATAYSTKANILSPQKVVILAMTLQYFSMIIVPTTCNPCSISAPTAIPEVNLRAGGYPLYPIYNDPNQVGQYCLNGGTIDPTYNGAGYKCICPAGVTVYSGPACEYMERSFNTNIMYLNVFRSATTINMRFSLFSIGVPGGMSLLSIKNNNFGKTVEVLISESTMVLTTENNKNSTIAQAIDNQNWYNFTLVVSNTNATLTIDAKSTVNLFTSATTGADFRSFYLILNENANTAFQVCMKNLIINSRIVDLSGPSYTTCCINRCTICGNNYCNCYPFVSNSNTNCLCKPGLIQSGTPNTCIPGTGSPAVEISPALVSTLPLALGQPLVSLDFGFQTRFVNGDLMTISLQNPSLNIKVQIVNTNLTLNIVNQRIRTLNYNISNGILHNVSMTFTPNLIVMTLDFNSNYSINQINWSNIAQFQGPITIASLNMGALQIPNGTTTAKSTCFSGLELNSLASPPTFLNATTVPNMLPQCSTGPRCVSIACPMGTVCNDSLWQNTQCLPICNATSTYMNNTSCVYNGCVTNPCLNNGLCFYNASLGNYSCICNGSFTGYNCNVSVITASVWWVAIIVILILLLIVLIVLLVYCCCCAAPKSKEVMHITKVTENTVAYNDQAGEADYTGPPINFAMMKDALNNKPKMPPPVLINPSFDLMTKKDEFDIYNKDLILDHPLEYGFEGFESENESVSSIGSKSGGSEINFADLGDMPDVYAQVDE